MSPYPSGAVHRASILTNGDDPADTAPEVDHAVQAPQCGRDRAGPEVTPGREAQVYYHTSPPEAIVDTCLEDTSDLSSEKDAASTRKPRKVFVFTVLAAILLVIIGLSVGLGVGLRHREKDVTPSPGPDPDLPSSATTTSTLAEPSATNDVAAHSVRLNSSLSAVTLPDGNRHVYFQEAAGGLRRALYSSRTKQWQQAAGGFSVLGAKNDTPLAAAVFRTAADNVFVNLVYVSPENLIRCRAWYDTTTAGDCFVLRSFPKTFVDPESRQIAFIVVSYDADRTALFMSYQDPNHLIVVMFGYIDYTEDTGHWYWEDYTHKLNRLLSSKMKDNQSDAYISHPCNGHSTAKGPISDSLILSCYTTEDDRAFFNITYFSSLEINNLTINDVQLVEKANELVHSPDVVLLASENNGLEPPTITMNGSAFVTDDGSMQAPDSPFPFGRLASAWDNATASYLYHQLDDLTLVEDMWDGGISNFWTSTNITIGTTISETFQESDDSDGVA